MEKFKNTEELEKAYKELEREFTKKSQKLAEMERYYNENIAITEKQFTEIEGLKKQLAEKEKEILNISEYFGKVTFELRELCNKKDQDKISFCIEQLEKVKEEFISEVWDLYDTADLLEQVCELRNEQIKFIDNKIKQLKEK